jgi:hypothetical protein
MKSRLVIIGAIFLVIGMIGYTQKSFYYSTNEKVAEVGNVSVSADKEKSINVPSIISGLSIAGGLLLIIVGLKRKS